VLAGVFEAEPNVLAEILAAARYAEAAFVRAPGARARAHLFLRLRTFASRLDADVGFESRCFAGRCHASIMGSKTRNYKANVLLDLRRRRRETLVP